MQAARYNEGKPSLSMPFEARRAMIGAARVLQYGATKYERNNWKKGLPTTQIADSLLRHLAAYLAGEDLDAESGERHVDHITVNALFLAEFAGDITFDDRGTP